MGSWLITPIPGENGGNLLRSQLTQVKVQMLPKQVWELLPWLSQEAHSTMICLMMMELSHFTMRVNHWTAVLVTALITLNTTTMPIFCVTMMLLMPVFASRLDGQRMGFQFMDTVMILKETSLLLATLSLMVTQNMKLKLLPELSKVLLMRITMSMWILMPAIWIKQMVQFTQQQENIRIS